MSKTKKPSYMMLMVMIPLGLIGFAVYKNTIIIEAGVLGMLGNLVYELLATKRNDWRYPTTSLYMIAGRLPVEVILTYLFTGMAAAAYVFFRLGF